MSMMSTSYSDRISDILRADILARRFERMSGQILNRNHKTAILGLGAWTGRQEWPLPWISSPDKLKVFGVTFCPSLVATITASWEATQQAAKSSVAGWKRKGVATLRHRRDVLETYVFSKLWYLAQILPLPSAMARQLTTMAGAYLWSGHFERLAWQELHAPLLAGGLAISCLASRAQALLTKQICWSIGHGGRAAGHWAYWIGHRLATHLPHLEDPGHQAANTPRLWEEAADTVLEVLDYETVSPAALLAAKAASIYSEFTDTPPLPKIVFKQPDLPWPTIWQRLWKSGLKPEEADLAFRLLHNILPLRGRLARFGVAEGACCRHCPGQQETATHLFCLCIRVADNWQQLLAALLPYTGPIRDEELLLLAWPPSPFDGDLVMAVVAYVSQIWATRGDRRPPSFRAFTATMRARPYHNPLW